MLVEGLPLDGACRWQKFVDFAMLFMCLSADAN